MKSIISLKSSFSDSFPISLSSELSTLVLTPALPATKLAFLASSLAASTFIDSNSSKSTNSPLSSSILALALVHVSFSSAFRDLLSFSQAASISSKVFLSSAIASFTCFILSPIVNYKSKFLKSLSLSTASFAASFSGINARSKDR